MTIAPSRSALRSLILTAALAVATHPVGALDWPVTQPSLTATFGEARGDAFSSGIAIDAADPRVHPSAAGKVIFSYSGEDPRDIPTGLGDFVVVDHGNALRTLYGHLRQGSIPRGITDVTPSDVIGLIGDTGDSTGPHLLFEVIDRTNHQFLNPLKALPPLASTAGPVIAGVFLDRDRQLTALSAQTQTVAGRSAVIVDAYDPSEFVDYFDPMAPYRIDVTLNGIPVSSVTFDALRADGGKLRLVGPGASTTFAELYASSSRYRMGSVDLKPGDQALVVRVSDFAGNVAEQSYLITAGSAP